MKIKVAWMICCVSLCGTAIAQNQLVLVKKNEVVLRYLYGDEIIYRLKNQKQYKSGVYLTSTEFTVITTMDTIAFSKIDRISLKGHKRNTLARTFGKAFMIAGFGYFLIDQFNRVVVNGQKADMEPSVWKPSLALVVTGFALWQVYPRSVRLRFPAKLVNAEYGSRLYKPIE